MKVYHKAFAVIFLIGILGFSMFNFLYMADDVKKELEASGLPSELSQVKDFTATVDTTLTSKLLFDYRWTEAYARIHNLLGKNEENSFKYVKDKDGMLYAGNFWNTDVNTPNDYVDRINRIRAAVKDKDTKVVVLLYPCLYNEKWSDGYYGMPYTDYNYLADDITALLRYYGIDHIDYRESFLSRNMKAPEIFYKTDHHWTIEAAFIGYTDMVNYLNNNFDAKLDPYYIDKENYSFTTHEDIFIGSQGRDAGVSYVGADDFTFVLPKFETDIVYEYESTLGQGTEKEQGSVEETLVKTSMLNIESFYERDLYAAYLGGVRDHDYIVNNNNTEGLDVLFLRDSFSSPVATFFSAYCHELEMYHTVEVDDSVVEKAVEEGDYDYIFIGLCIDGYVNGGMEFFTEVDSDE